MSENEKLNNTEQQPEEIEVFKKSLQEKKKNVYFFWKSFLLTGVIIIGAIIGVLLGSIAWFVMNSQVHSGSTAVSASDGYTFSLATLKSDDQGIYDINQPANSESFFVDNSPLAKALNKFFRADNNGRDDDEGNHYTQFLDLPNLYEGTNVFTDKDGKKYIVGDSDGISLRVNAESNVNNTTEFEHIGPGSHGKFTFYIIPHVDGFQTVKLSVSLKPFTLVREGDVGAEKRVTGRAKLVENNEDNTVLLNMLQGHILLFTGKDEAGNYENRILPNLKDDGTVCFTFDKDRSTTTWVKDQPESITIYWIWPKRFENIKYYGQEDSVFESDCMSHTELLEWINTNRNYVVNTKTVDTTKIANPIGNMTNKEFAQWSVGYNKGDQLIGDNIAFFQWVIDAK